MQATTTVTEYVLYRVEADGARSPLFSDLDLDIVHDHRRDVIRASASMARPVLVITKRECTYPVTKDKDGKDVFQALGSTCDETDVHP